MSGDKLGVNTRGIDEGEPDNKGDEGHPPDEGRCAPPPRQPARGDQLGSLHRDRHPNHGYW
jgi:hypothetical protein